MALKEEIVGLICKTFDIEASEVKDDEKLYDSIGVDSTDMVELVVCLKKQFEVPFETDEITKFSTLNEIVSVVESKKK